MHTCESRTATYDCVPNPTNLSRAFHIDNLFSILFQKFFVRSYQRVSNSYIYIYIYESQTAHMCMSHEPQQVVPQTQILCPSSPKISLWDHINESKIHICICIRMRHELHAYEWVTNLNRAVHIDNLFYFLFYNFLDRHLHHLRIYKVRESYLWSSWFISMKFVMHIYKVRDSYL